LGKPLLVVCTKIQEMMYKNMYIQDRILDKNRDFEATETIVAGNNVTFLSSYWHTKHINTGDVVIKNGTTVNFKAGESIHLSQGFRVESGANFHAYLDSEMKQATKEVINSYPRHSILGNKIFSDTTTLYTNAQDYESIEWHIIGNDYEQRFYTNEISLSNLPQGQFSVFCYVSYQDTTIGTSDIIKSKKDLLIIPEDNYNPTENNIKISPNPASGIISISIPNNEETFDIFISSSIGDIVLTQRGMTNGNEINISNLLPGVYEITIKLQNEIYHEKFIKN